MQRNIIRHYVELGCDIPPDLSCVRIIQGRPFINVSLFQLVVAQLGGDPALIAEQVGGPLPTPSPVTRLAWWKLLRAAVLAATAIRRASKRAPAWFSEMRRMPEDHTRDRLKGLLPIELWDRLDRVGQRLAEGDLTFAIVSGASQGLHSLRWLLARRLGDDWRPTLNASVQGIGTVISARQIFLMAELAETARNDTETRAFFTNETWEPGQHRTTLAGSVFLESFDRYLKEYGHRAIGESDVMSPRFEENPGYLLDVVRGHLLSEVTTSVQAVQHRQAATRKEALARIEASFEWRWHERILFRWWHRELCRYLALREANRHHLMHFTSAVRRLLLALGAALVADGTLESEEDVFFFTIEELRDLTRREEARSHGRSFHSGGLGSGKDERARQDWKAIVHSRRAERDRHAAHTVPDFVGVIALGSSVTDHPSSGLVGLPISSGYAEGKVCLIRSSGDFTKVERGDILVVSVIDPGLAPLFGLAGGLIAEMGGILSHGAIIAREYGIPAVVNIPGITGLLTDADRVAVDGATGEVRILGRPG